MAHAAMHQGEGLPIWMSHDAEAEAKKLVASIFRDVFVDRPDFWRRSLLRSQEQERKRNPPHDSHARLYQSMFTATDRRIWVCRCGCSMRHMDRPRDATGSPKSICTHCLADYYNPEAKKRRAQEARARAKLREQTKGGRTPKSGKYAPHDAHVKTRQIHLRVVFDAHVRLFKSDAARVERWKMRNNPGYRLNVRLRVSIRKALKGGKQGRSWESFVGYTLADLVDHLERQLPKRTTLKAALDAGWHIDHITPKSTFDLANPDELRKAWSLANLRLIPAAENLRKGARPEFLL